MSQPTEPLLCAYLALVEDLALLDRDVSPSDDMDECAETAAYSIAVIRRRPGQDVEIYTAVCEEHADATEGIPGRRDKAIRLAAPKRDRPS